jgi:hypothetical protein
MEKVILTDLLDLTRPLLMIYLTGLKDAEDLL